MEVSITHIRAPDLVSRLTVCRRMAEAVWAMEVGMARTLRHTVVSEEGDTEWAGWAWAVGMVWVDMGWEAWALQAR
jgi:hypothetical protein